MRKQVGNVQLMQKMNRLKVLNLIRRSPDISRPLISEQTGLSLSSITNITSYLLDLGLLVECGTEQAERVGRKSTLLRFRAEAYGLIFAEFNQSRANVFYTDLEGKILSQVKTTIEELSPENVLLQLESHISALLKKHGKKHTLGIGVIFSGLVLDGNRFVFSSSMKWNELEIRKHLEEKTGLPVFVENISRIRAASYSSCSKEQEAKNMLFVDLDNGIGAVQLCRGAINRYVLGEIGHTTIEKGGEPCFCGNRGCLEAMCSAKRVIRLYEQQSGKQNAELSDIEELLKKNNSAAISAVHDCAEYLGIGLANLVTLLNPSLLVINMGDFADCPSLIDEAVSQMKKRAYLALTCDMEIKRITVDSTEALKGAAFELCDRLFDLSFPRNIVQ